MARILVVDDNITFLDMVCEVLKRSGHEVTSAPDGEIALKFFYNGKFDLVILDLIMPNKDGMEVVMELRKNFPDQKIIAISGGDRSFAADSYLTITKKLGADRIFEKPFKNRELVEAVNELLDCTHAA